MLYELDGRKRKIPKQIEVLTRFMNSYVETITKMY